MSRPTRRKCASHARVNLCKGEYEAHLDFDIIHQLNSARGIILCANEQVSRNQAVINEKETACFFDQIKNRLSNDEDKRLLGLQQAAIKNLEKERRYDEQYLITINGTKTDIDLTIHFNKNNPSLLMIYSAGPKKYLEILIMEIETQCKIHFEAVDNSK